MFRFIGGMFVGASIGFIILALIVNGKESEKQDWCDGGCKTCNYTEHCIFHEE